MGNYFESFFRGKLFLEQVSNLNIWVGCYSYYFGYYYGYFFDDCVCYLMLDCDDVDKLVIGSFCLIGSGVVFIMVGNQGYCVEWVLIFFFYFMYEELVFVGVVNGYQLVGDMLIGYDVWIGIEVMFMFGVWVGYGVIIGSCVLVIGDVEFYVIVGGNLVWIICKCFFDGDIQNLLEMVWWDWLLVDIEVVMLLLCVGDIFVLYWYWKQCQVMV